MYEYIDSLLVVIRCNLNMLDETNSFCNIEKLSTDGQPVHTAIIIKSGDR